MLHVTRESRLAIVVGFSLVLVVGVLVSDHLSRAREAEPEYGLTDTERQTLEPTRLLRDAPETSTSPPATDPQQAPGAPPTTGPTENAVAEANNPGSAPIGTDVVDEPWVLTLGEQDNDPDAGPRRERRPLIPLIGRDTRRGEDPPDPQSPPHEATPRWHTVSEGETLYAIAERYLGNGSRWPELARLNSSRVSDEGGVRTGVRLRLPGSSRDPRAKPTRPSPTEPTSGPNAGTRETIEYVVKRGEVFSQLAQRFMGTVRRQEELLELNASRIDDPDDLRAGMTILIPAGPSRADR